LFIAFVAQIFPANNIKQTNNNFFILFLSPLF